MAENKLSSGVGKKIVQALKKQAEADIQSVSDTIENSQSVIKNAVDETVTVYEESPALDEQEQITDNVELEDDFSTFSQEQPVETFESFDEDTINKALEDSFVSDFNDTFDNLGFDDSSVSMFEEKELFKPAPQPVQQMSQKSYAMPANVAVLKRLIMQLPQGVSKQTGAQIIRQTMEALGISMNSVLKEAQQGQDSITASAKACLATIAEYKNNIRGLEKQVQDYKKQAVALNDLISLFVLTDK